MMAKYGNSAELKAYEEQINSLQYKLINSKRIVEEQQDKIKEAKKELLVLWKMEINATVDKKRENLGLPMSRKEREKRGTQEISTNAIKKLKRVSRWKTCDELNYKNENTSNHIKYVIEVFLYMYFKKFITFIIFLTIISLQFVVYAEDMDDNIDWAQIEEILKSVRSRSRKNSKYKFKTCSCI